MSGVNIIIIATVVYIHSAHEIMKGRRILTLFLEYIANIYKEYIANIYKEYIANIYKEYIANIYKEENIKLQIGL